MSSNSDNNKRIAKNTLLLYFRMLFLMAISLYTSRIVLNALGVEDFGIYNVVGGIVAMFSIFSGSLSTSISRFITYELGKENKDKLKIIFSSAVTIQLGLGLFIVLIAETVGLWFLNFHMNIPEDRMTAANWVLQFSVITFVINLISVPYNASIIAHEKMSAFAYISILEATGKLLIAYLVTVSLSDKLILYAILMCVVALIIRLTYGSYCKRHFEECTYQFIFDKRLLKEMFGFAGWNFFGNGAYLLNTQGVNILINLFFGTSVNTARGIVVQVEGAILQFVNNFTTAINPQITKSYASKDWIYMYQLIHRGAKFSYFILLILAIPFILEAPTILKLWLEIVPEYSVVFLRLTIVSSLITVTGNSLLTAILASGKIKRYQIVVTAWGCCVFPLTYLVFRMGFPPQSTYILYLLVYLVLIFIRIYLAKGIIQLPVTEYMKEVFLRISMVSIFSFLIPCGIFFTLSPTISRLLLIIITSILSTICSIYFIGLQKKERQFIISKIKWLPPKKQVHK